MVHGVNAPHSSILFHFPICVYFNPDVKKILIADSLGRKRSNELARICYLNGLFWKHVFRAVALLPFQLMVPHHLSACTPYRCSWRHIYHRAWHVLTGKEIHIFIGNIFVNTCEIVKLDKVYCCFWWRDFSCIVNIFQGKIGVRSISHSQTILPASRCGFLRALSAPNEDTTHANG